MRLHYSLFALLVVFAAAAALFGRVAAGEAAGEAAGLGDLPPAFALDGFVLFAAARD